MAKKERYKTGSWGWLLTLCVTYGKETVLEQIEADHRRLQERVAALWADPDTHSEARKAEAVLLQQTETLIRLQAMTEDDMRLLLAAGEADAEGRGKCDQREAASPD